MNSNDRKTRADLMGHPEWVLLPWSKDDALKAGEKTFYTGRRLPCEHTYAPQHVDDLRCAKCHERAVKLAEQWPDMTERRVVEFLRAYVQARFTTDETLFKDGAVIERNGELLFLFKVFAAEAQVKMRGEKTFLRRVLDEVPVRRGFNTFVLGTQCRPYALRRDDLEKKVAALTV